MAKVFRTEKYIVSKVEWVGDNSYVITFRSTRDGSEITFSAITPDEIALGDIYIGEFKRRTDA
jgi:hypothetical protein